MGDEGKQRLDEFNVQVLERLAEPPWNSTYAKDNGIPVGLFKYIVIKLVSRGPYVSILYAFILNQDTVSDVISVKCDIFIKNIVHKCASALLVNEGFQIYANRC